MKGVANSAPTVLSIAAGATPLDAPIDIFEGVRDAKNGNWGGALASLAAVFGLDFIKDAKKVANAVPKRMSRVIPADVGDASSLGKVSDSEVFVTAAEDIADATDATDVATKLTLKNADGSTVEGPFKVITFDTPSTGVATPINRTNPGFVGGGKTAGGVREFTIPNKKIEELENVSTTTIK